MSTRQVMELLGSATLPVSAIVLASSMLASNFEAKDTQPASSFDSGSSFSSVEEEDEEEEAPRPGTCADLVGFLWRLAVVFVVRMVAVASVPWKKKTSRIRRCGHVYMWLLSAKCAHVVVAVAGNSSRSLRGGRCRQGAIAGHLHLLWHTMSSRCDVSSKQLLTAATRGKGAGKAE